MADADDIIELLFFDTFSHEIHEDINLDLVQFPQPVYITEVRIIPLGARVQADFPGGVRLGATNPSKFHIEFFVNDLAKPGASSFESLGDFQYNQNGCIHLQCPTADDRTTRQIPTDGLVLRGWYTTITLAVYGSLAKDTITEAPISSPPPAQIHIEPISATSAVVVPSSIDTKLEQGEIDWQQSSDRKAGVSYYAGNGMEQTPLTPATPLTPSQKDISRQYTENWVGSNIASGGRAKSPENDWDDNDEVNKNSPATISSPKSARRSRSPTEGRRIPKREWSKSPEYRHRRSYERGVLDKKLSKTREYEGTLRRSPPSPPSQHQPRMPRTPSPEVVHSPSSRRPRTPERRLSDDFNKHKYQPKSVRSPKSLTDEPIGVDSIGNTSVAPTEGDDDAMSQGEAFEPILSDDEIGGDDNFEQYELDYDDHDHQADSALVHFNPFVEELRRYKPSNEDMSANAKELIELATKCLHRSKVKETGCVKNSFINVHSTELKENWVHACEQLIQIINLIYNLAGATQSRSQQVLNKLVLLNRHQLVDWMKIGLDFDCANAQQQPGYKIRHIKCGVRLLELLAADDMFIECLLLKEKFDVFQYLFKLYEQKFMALSIKLMICKALYACLDSKVAIEYFTQESSDEDIKGSVGEPAHNGYQKLIKLLEENPLTRIKFALKSILKKLNLYESLQTIRDIVNRYFIADEKFNIETAEVDLQADQQLLRNCLREVNAASTWDSLSYSQPKRFLPVSTKFERAMDTNAAKACIHGFLQYYRTHSLLESLFVIISNNGSILSRSLVTEEVFDKTLLLLEALCRTASGLDFLSSNAEVTNAIAKCLLQSPAHLVRIAGAEDQGPELITNDYNNVVDDDSRMHQLGIEISYKMKAKYCLDAIADITLSTENREEQLVELFHSLYSLAVADNYIGRQYVANTISMNNNIMIILKQIEYEKKAINTAATVAAAVNVSSTEATANGTTLSPILNYAVDLIDLIVRYTLTNLDYLRTHGQILVGLVKSHDQFESTMSQILQDLAVYLKPLEVSSPFSYDNITPICEVIKRSVEFITTFPGDLIMALRIIRYLAIPSIPLDSSSDLADTFGDAGAANSLMQNKSYSLEHEQHQVELKYKFVILQFYSAEGILICASILEKLATYFTQPAAHSAALSTSQGVLATHILLPTMELLRKMLTYVIDCRNTEFKDLTAIEPMLKIYTLMGHIPSHSNASAEAQQVQSEIVKTLLAYTQPTPITGLDTESVHKSLWTQMVGELIKYILNGPHTFMTGLSLFTQLLPIPLPLTTKRPLTANETARLITERQFWSAHLHPKSIAVSEMIQALCISSYAPLLDLLSRVIVQLADLAPNMSLLITKAIIDLLLTDGTSSIVHQTSDSQNAASTSTATATPTSSTSLTATQQPSLVMTYINPQTKRLLAFLTNILCYPCVKVAFLSIFHGKVYEFLIKILGVKTASLPSHLWPILIQEQEHVLTIFHTILNADITMLANDEGGAATEKNILAPETMIACALPPKECLPGIVASVCDNFLCVDEQLNTFANQFAALKTMMILTEYDFTTYQLKLLLDKRKEALLTKIRNLNKLNEGDTNAHEILITFLLFLQSLIWTDLVKSERNYSINESDFANILSFKKQKNNEETLSDEPKHPLLALDEHVASILGQSKLTEDIKAQIEDINFNLKAVLKALESGSTAGTVNGRDIQLDSPGGEPPFAQSEGIVTQYTLRPIFTTMTNEIGRGAFADQLTTSYWCARPSPSRIDEATELPSIDQISCDLNEMIKICLPSDTNLTTDCKRLLHLSSSPQSNRERTTAAPCFRTRRVEVEPSTGRPEKKIYITRGRGFARPAPTRGDLFRSRPPNTSRPPSLHVDDFLALETCGAQPTGPTGYNKLSRDIISIRGSRGRGRGFDRGRIGLNARPPYQHALRRTNSPSTWSSHNIHDTSASSTPTHYRTATAEPVHHNTPHFQNEYSSTHFGTPIRGRGRGTMRPPRGFNKFQ